MQHLYKLPILFGTVISKRSTGSKKKISALKTRIETLQDKVDSRITADEDRKNALQEIRQKEEEIRNLEDVLSAKNSPACSLKESIAQRIHLILMTHYGEYRFDYQFGCSLWEHDFEILYNFGRWRDEMIVSITKAIEANEPRLTHVNVKVDINQEEFISRGPDIRKMKLKVTTKVYARIRGTNEEFSFGEQLYLSPISFD